MVVGLGMNTLLTVLFIVFFVLGCICTFMAPSPLSTRAEKVFIWLCVGILGYVEIHGK